MSLLINARFLSQPITGVQRYGIEISRALKQLDPTVKLIAPRNIIYHDIANELEVETVGHLTGHLWEQIELPLYLKKAGKPLLMNLSNTAPLGYGNNVVVLHDAAFERLPQTFSWKFRTFYQFLVPRILKRSKAIVTVSNFSKSEITSLYKVDYNNISVVYNSVSDFFQPTSCTAPGKYLLAVSSLNYQKNFASLVKAFTALNRNDIKLFLVGAFNKNFADISLLNLIEHNPNIILKGRVSDEELKLLYSNALCFVYPSLYEGFGIPPLEAQACGCPVIVSGVASLPEVCGDSAVYCDPYDIEDIAEMIAMVIDSPDLRADLRCRGFENIARFSWNESANKILHIAEKLT